MDKLGKDIQVVDRSLGTVLKAAASGLDPLLYLISKFESSDSESLFFCRSVCSKIRV